MYNSLSNAIENVLRKAGNLTCLQLLLILQHRTTFPWHPVGDAAMPRPTNPLGVFQGGQVWAHGLVGDYCQSPRCLPIDTSCTTPATLPRNSTGCQPPTRLTITKPKNNSTSQINKSKMSLWKHTSFYQKKTVKAMQRFNLSSAVKEPKMAHQDQRAPPDSPDLNDKIWASTTWQRWDPDRHYSESIRSIFGLWHRGLGKQRILQCSRHCQLWVAQVWAQVQINANKCQMNSWCIS